MFMLLIYYCNIYCHALWGAVEKMYKLRNQGVMEIPSLVLCNSRIVTQEPICNIRSNQVSDIEGGGPCES